jgi:tRNA-2-methylthio-N6-dimethylallyladenosine synthase
MPDDVPEAEKMARFRALEDLQASIAGEINAAFLGRTVEVLVEDAYRGRWKGRTRSNKLVIFDIPAGSQLPQGMIPDWRGRLVQVLVEWTGPWSLVGRLTDNRPG